MRFVFSDNQSQERRTKFNKKNWKGLGTRLPTLVRIDVVVPLVSGLTKAISKLG